MAVWLGAFIVGSAALRYLQLADVIPVPWIFPDELRYAELAKSFGTSGHFTLREVPFHELSYGLMYPVAISPAYALTDNLPQAYAIARAISCALMALAAVPVYLLGRRVLSPGLALIGAVLAIEIPSMAYSATIMTENLFYPAFLFAVLAIVLAVEQPTTLRQLGALAAIAFVVLTRLEGLALVPAYLSAVMLFARLDARQARPSKPFARQLAAYRVTGALVVVGALALGAFEIVRGKHVSSVLGAYQALAGRYSLAEIPRWFLYHLADLDLYVGFVPFAAAIVLAVGVLRGRERSRQVRAFVAVSLGVFFWLTLLVSAYASAVHRPTDRLYERYVFHLVPLLLIAMLVWLQDGSARRSRLVVGAVVVAGVLPALIPFHAVVNNNMRATSPGLLPWAGFSKSLVAPSYAWAIALGLGVVAGVLFLAVPKRYRLVFPTILLLNFLVVGFFVTAHYARISSAAASAGAASERDWIDRAVGRDATVAAVWPGRLHRGLEGRYAIWENELFNESVGPVYDLREPLKYLLPETRVRVDPASGVISDFNGRAISARYVLSDRTFPLLGRVVARDARTGVVLYETGGIVRAARVPAGT